MQQPESLQYGAFYHIYNRGNNGEILFREPRNYSYFLRLYAAYIEPVAETYAYCLMSNHFHLLVRIKDLVDCEQDCQSSKDWQSSKYSSPSRAFSNLFSTYTKAFNKAYQRTGSLFEKPFRRKRVDHDRYFTALVVYIHRNPQHHGFVTDFRDWPYSSYPAIVSDKASRVWRDVVIAWFNSRREFAELHLADADAATPEPLIGDDGE